MCPACISAAAWIVAGAISTGGLATLVRLKFRAPAGASIYKSANHELINHEGEERNEP
jgi:hypothetical protein